MYGVKDSIINKSEENRAALAEYINQSFEKSKRKTGWSITSNSDGIDETSNKEQKKSASYRALNRYYFDNYTTHFDNLFGGYVENDELIPVRFGLKHGKGGEAVLYVIVDQDAIPLKKILQKQKKKAEVIGKAGPQIAESSLPISTFKYSIPQIVDFVKTKDSLRYLPDEWLSEEQKKH